MRGDADDDDADEPIRDDVRARANVQTFLLDSIVYGMRVCDPNGVYVRGICAKFCVCVLFSTKCGGDEGDVRDDILPSDVTTNDAKHHIRVECPDVFLILMLHKGH